MSSGCPDEEAYSKPAVRGSLALGDSADKGKLRASVRTGAQLKLCCLATKIKQQISR